MPLINPTELLDKLSGVSLDDEDRKRLWETIQFCGLMITAVVSILGVLSFLGEKEVALVAANALSALAKTLGGVAVLLVLIFVGGTVTLKNSTTRSVMQASGKGGSAPPPASQATGGTTINLNSPQETVAPVAAPAIAADVKEVKQKVKVIDANVKEVKEQTKKDAAVAVGAVVKTIKNEVAKATKRS